MINKLHQKLFTNNTPFAYAAITGLIIGVGDLIATGTDIYWLIGDMKIGTHNHHYFTMIGLSTAFLVMLISFIYLYIAIHKFLIKRDNKEKRILLSHKIR